MLDCDARAEIDSLLSWWHEAGVDTAIGETPRQWLGEEKPAQAPKADRVERDIAPAPPEIRAPDVPSTLDALLAWLATDTTALAAYPAGRRIAPALAPGADMMVVADIPEAGDPEAQRLLSGDVGALVDKMLAAMGRDRSSTHIVTIAPARPPLGRLDDAEQQFLAPVVRQLVALTAPKKLWLLGRAASRALLGMDETEAAGRLHSVNQNDRMMDVIATVHPRILLREPKLKARVWEDMKRLIEGPTA